MSEVKKRYSPEQKAMILREHLKNQVSIGELSEKHGIHPNLLYQWEKELFEHAADIFRCGKDESGKKLAAEVAHLQAKLKDRNDVIGEIIEDNIRLKKKLNGDL